MPAEKGRVFGYGFDPLFLLSLGVYVLNREWIKPGLHGAAPFLRGHLNDCLLAPVALPLFLFFYRRIGLRPDDAPPRFWEMLLHVAVWSVFFEWFGPRFLHRGTSDWGDAGCYLAGGLVSWAVWRCGYGEGTWLFFKKRMARRASLQGR